MTLTGSLTTGEFGMTATETTGSERSGELEDAVVGAVDGRVTYESSFAAAICAERMSGMLGGAGVSLGPADFGRLNAGVGVAKVGDSTGGATTGAAATGAETIGELMGGTAAATAGAPTTGERASIAGL